MVWCRLEESYSVCPRAAEWVCLPRVDLRHLPSTARLHSRLAIWQLYLASKWYLARVAGYKTGVTLRWRTVNPPLSTVTLTMAQQNQDTPTFTTPLSDPHFNLSTHTFTRETLEFNNISFTLDLLLHDDVATQNLLTLDQINQTIVGLEWQLDEHHRLVTRHFSSLLQWQAAQHFPQRLHDHLHPDCGCCCLRRWWPTPFSSPAPSSSSLSSSPFSLTGCRRQWTSPRARPLPPVPSSSTTTLPLYPPLMTCSTLHSWLVQDESTWEITLKQTLPTVFVVSEQFPRNNNGGLLSSLLLLRHMKRKTISSNDITIGSLTRAGIRCMGYIGCNEG